MIIGVFGAFVYSTAKHHQCEYKFPNAKMDSYVIGRKWYACLSKSIALVVILCESLLLFRHNYLQFI